MTAKENGWASIDVGGDAPSDAELLSRAHKADSVDACRALVREGRFTESFMMGTNGGAMFEPMLRPPPPPAPAEPGRAAPPGGTLQNVLGADERVAISDTSLIPARSVGLLRIVYGGAGIRWGTAWLIGPRTLATAAHNLVHPEHGNAIRLEVGMAYDGATARGGWHRITGNKLPQAWLHDPSDTNAADYAVIRIDDAGIGNRLGWFGFADYEDAKFRDLALNLFGYPMDVKRPFAMHGARGRAVGVDAGRIYYDCDAGGGMSGGPVVARFGEQRIAVGIHVGGGTTANTGTRLTAEAYQLFKAHEAW
jgi:glutamyl endopeptidase